MTYITKKDLAKFGKVEYCGEVNGEFQVIITEGFRDELDNIVECVELITESISKDYPEVRVCTPTSDYFKFIAGKGL